MGMESKKIFSGYITGDTGFSIPGAPGSISMVVGFETKELDADFRPDLPSRTGDRSGSGGATLAQLVVNMMLMNITLNSVFQLLRAKC